MCTLGEEFQHTLSECWVFVHGVITAEDCVCVSTRLVLLGGAHLCGACFGSRPDFLDRGASGKKIYSGLPCLLPRSVAFPSIAIVVI